MSTPFYDLASLVLVPSGYKASKVYAQKPLTTDGQLTFSRASTATRVNSAGLIETVASNVPRLDYLNSSCPKLQLEPSRTNKCPSSANYGNSFINTTATRNTVSAPNGVTEADTLQDDNTLGEHLLGENFDSITNGLTYTVSCFFKANGSGGRAVIRYFVGSWTFAVYNLANGTVALTDGVGTASIQNYGNGWYRCILTATASTDYTPFVTQIGVANSNNQFSYQGTSSLGLYFWGYQAETGAYATSIIPTTTAAVTRLADLTKKTSASDLIGQTEGTIFGEFQFPNVTIEGTSSYLGITGGSFSNCVLIGREPGIPPKYAFYIIAGGVTYLANTSQNLASGTAKLALAYKSGSWAAYLNGTLVASGTSTFSFGASLNQVAIGPNDSAMNTQTDIMLAKQAILFKTRLTNAQLAELTTL